VNSITDEAGNKPAQEPMAFTLRQAATLLNVSYPTAYRLNKRGLLRSAGALRTKLIPRTEIERFLSATLEHQEAA
jgi:excisionase family DNA binding protein